MSSRACGLLKTARERYAQIMSVPDRSAIDAFIASCRARCLWSFAPDHGPLTDASRALLLSAIKRNGSLEDFKRAAEYSSWLSPPSNDRSLGF